MSSPEDSPICVVTKRVLPNYESAFAREPQLFENLQEPELPAVLLIDWCGQRRLNGLSGNGQAPGFDEAFFRKTVRRSPWKRKSSGAFLKAWNFYMCKTYPPKYISRLRLSSWHERY